MSTVKFKFESGIEVRDRASNVTGIIVARSEWINGCLRYTIQPKASISEPSKMPDGYWVDEAQLEKIGEGLNEKPIPKSRTGGPTIKAPRF